MIPKKIHYCWFGGNKPKDILQSDAFKHLFQQFTASYDQYKYFRGYRLLAVDGSTFNIGHNPADETTYIKSSTAKKGYNSLHLNALYDLTN